MVDGSSISRSVRSPPQEASQARVESELLILDDLLDKKRKPSHKRQLSLRNTSTKRRNDSEICLLLGLSIEKTERTACVGCRQDRHGVQRSGVVQLSLSLSCFFFFFMSVKQEGSLRRKKKRLATGHGESSTEHLTKHTRLSTRRLPLVCLSDRGTDLSLAMEEVCLLQLRIRLSHRLGARKRLQSEERTSCSSLPCFFR